MSGNPSGSKLSGKVFNWIPASSQVGSYDVTFTVSDGNGGKASETVKIGVTAGNQPPKIAPDGDKSVKMGKELKFTLSASDADGDN